MTDEQWPLTSKAIADSERAMQGDYDLTDDEPEPELGNSLLRELAAEGCIEEVTPGRYWMSKLRPDRDKLS
jgi:hypothetical protein